MMSKNLLVTEEERGVMLPAFDEDLLFSLERRYFDMLDIERLELAMNPASGDYNYRSDLRLVRIDEISHSGPADRGLHLVNMQNVLSALKDDGHSIVNAVVADGKTTRLYYGLSRRPGHKGQISTHAYSEILEQEEIKKIFFCL